MANIWRVDRANNKVELGTTDTTITIASHTASQSLALDASKNLESVDLSAVYQPLDDVLTDLAALTAVADNEFIVGTGAGTYAHESGATVRTSIGLGTGDSPTFTGLNLSTDIIFSASARGVRANTSDGSDSYEIFIAGGGAVTSNRGAFIACHGNEHLTFPGELHLIKGTAASGRIRCHSELFIKEIAAANADLAGYGQLWAKTATPNTLWFTDDTGDDFQIGGSMASIIITDGGTIGQAAGPLLTFDDTNNFLEITGCKVGIGIAVPTSELHLKGTIGCNVRLDGNADGQPYLYFMQNGVGKAYIQYIDNGASTDYLRYDAPEHYFSTGDVGIGILPVTPLTVEGIITLPKASGNGIKVDTTTPTFGWADLQAEPSGINTGASKPTQATYRDTLKQFQFAAGDEEYYEYHIPHDYVAGTDIHIHVHWSHIGAFVTGGTITFTVESSYAKGHNQAPFSASVSGDFNGTASTTQYQHIVSEIQLSASSPAGLQIDTDDLEPDGIIMMRILVKTNDITVSEGAVPNPFIHHADVHYQTTGLIGTKQKAPPFYT